MNDIVKAWDVAHERARDIRVEQAVLGACLNKPAILDWLDLEPEAFWDPRHRHIWLALREMAERREPVDEVNLGVALMSRGRFEMCGGPLYLAELGLRCPTVDNVVSYAETLRRLLVTRRLLDLGSSLPSRVADGCLGEDLLGDVLLGLGEIEPVKAEEGDTPRESVRQELSAVFEFSERRAKGEAVAGVPTGISILDARIGGLPFGTPSVLGARPGTGKSSLALCIATSAARAGIPSQIVTYEDRRHVFAQRLLSQESGVDVSRISARSIDRPDMADLVRGAEKVAATESLDLLRIDHGHGLDVSRMVRMVRARRRQLGTRLVVVDYLQLIPPQPHEKRLRRDEQIEASINALADLSGTENIAVLVVSQLNRAGEEEGRKPRLSDFRGSGAIEQVGKLVLALHPAQREDEVEVLILKNHQGPPSWLIARWDRARCWIGG